MLIVQANELTENERIYSDKGNPLTFLAGPWKDDKTPVWHIAVRNANGTVLMVNLNHVMLAKNMPKVGDVWVGNYNEKIHIVELTGNFVIYKMSLTDEDDDAIITTTKTFLQEYYRQG